MGRAVLGTVVVLGLGCGSGGSSGSPSVAAHPLVLLADTNRNGTIDEADPTELADKGTWDAKHGAVFLANIDDDTKSCPTKGSDDVALAACNDAADEVVNGADDLLDLAPLKVLAWPAAPSDATATLSLDAPAAPNVRLFKDAGGTMTVFNPATDVLTAAELRAGVALAIEGKDIVRDTAVWDGFANVTVTATRGATTLASDTVRMRLAPVIFPSHVNDPQRVFVSDTTNDPTGDTYRAAITSTVNGDGIPTVTTLEASDDIWAQDYFETAFMTMPAPGGQHNIRVNFRSSNYSTDWSADGSTVAFRPGGLVVWKTLRGKDVAGVVAFDPKHDDNMDSLNSFGNHETVPPYDLGAASYPFGRVIRGKTDTFYPDPVFVKMVESQRMQDPIYVDTSWLLVGHIDEILSFVPVDGPRGWALLYADPARAKTMLTQLVTDGQGAALLHDGMQWYDAMGTASPAAISVTAVLADQDVMTVSQKASLMVSGIVDSLTKETGLTDAEKISVPFLFHTEASGAIAYQPGMVNGISLGKGHFASPKPHGPMIAGKDPFATAMTDGLAPLKIAVDFVEDWDLLHTAEGEIHCGSNTERALPATNFWTTGR